MKKDIKYKKNVTTNFFSVAPGIWGMKDMFVNMYMILNHYEGNWVLLDAGLKWSAPKIKKMATQLFGKESRPSAILLTHGHFDHVGSLAKLAEEWDVPVYAHHYEIPYLTGKSAYPPPDPSVGGGIMASLSWMYPKGPINIWNRINVLPPDGSVPHLREWKYIHTPGHAPGHVSFYRERDGVLIAGDAFVTTQQESAMSVMFQKKKLSGPPAYFTYDWQAASQSVNKLALLEPDIVATGHGRPMKGSELRKSLHNLARNFEDLGLPSRGRYLKDPARINAQGVVYIPPPVDSNKWLLRIMAVSAVTAMLFVLYSKSKKKRSFDLDNLLPS